MKKSIKISIIVAAALMLAGLVITAVGLSINGFKFPDMTETKRVDLNGEFEKIIIDVDTTDIKFTLSESTESYVELTESTKRSMHHGVTVKDGVLKIELEDERDWYEHVGIGWGDWKINICLSKADFESISIETDTGDVEMPAGFAFENASVDVDTGDVSWAASVSNRFELDSDTGDIDLSGVSCQSLDIETDTGDVSLKDTVTAGPLLIKTTTGDVSLDSCDGGTLNIKTSTGDVRGTLLTGKVFLAKSSTGNITVPENEGTSECKINSSTGDITLKIKK